MALSAIEKLREAELESDNKIKEAEADAQKLIELAKSEANGIIENAKNSASANAEKAEYSARCRTQEDFDFYSKETEEIISALRSKAEKEEENVITSVIEKLI
ncbi:MAG: hypothetical protein K6F76_04480 [Clostridiales bacterium]|nr:hypothetical protein [Clostridiales bacterium]